LNDQEYRTSQHHFTCPHCGERISMLLDLSAGSQRYVEDCEVCCNPIAISYDTDEGRLVRFKAGIT
jgi:transcription elongation factor Elf1